MIATPAFTSRIRPFVTAELERAAQAETRGDAALAFAHLERAHILSQPSLREHLRVHLQMLRWGWRQRSPREVRGQLLRFLGAAVLTPFGLAPTGNTGGSNVSPTQRMPIPPDLEAILAAARNPRRS